MLAVALGIGLACIGVFSGFSRDSQGPVKTDYMVEEQRKDHSNTSYSAPPGTRLVEIDFAAEIGEGEARTLAVGEGDDNKVLIAKY